MKNFTRCAALVIATHASGCGRATDDPLVARGTVEQVEIDVAPLSLGRVVSVRVREGEAVRQGDTLLTLTQTTEQAEIEGYRARVAAAEARLRDLELGARPAETERLVAELRSAEAEVARTASDARRADSLLAGGNISAQQQEAARTAALTAAARRDATRESLRLLREGTRPQQVVAARAELASAGAALAAFERRAADLVLVAPATGVVTSRNAEAGEVIAPGYPAMTIADVTRPYLRVYLRTRAIPLLAIGDSASATLDDFPGRRFVGRVTAISPRAEFTPRVALTEEERADLLFAVRVEFEDATGMLKAGLPASVRIHARGDAVR